MSTKAILPRSPLTDPANILLADAATRVQLSRTNHHKAVFLPASNDRK